jgi:hypothetical protein
LEAPVWLESLGRLFAKATPRPKAAGPTSGRLEELYEKICAAPALVGLRRSFVRKIGAAVLLLVLSSGACARPKAPAPQFVVHPGGNGLWFAEGFAAREDPAAAEAALSRAGFAWVLLPGARIERAGDRWIVVKRDPPSRPLAHSPVCLVVEGGEEVAAALASPDAGVRRELENAVALAVKTALAQRSRFGPVAGIHLDLPFTAATASPYGDLLRSLRPRLPSGAFLSASLKFDPPPGDREKLDSVASAADGLVAMVFGEEGRASPASTDLLGRSWWVGYSPSAEGRWTGTRGGDSLPESFLARLSDDPGLEFRHDMDVEEKGELGYIFRARHALTFDGRSFSAGDQIVFRQPSMADMIRGFGSELAGWRFARGRVIRLAGKSESERIFTLAALNEILFGHSLSPDLRVSIERGAGSVAVSAQNLSPLPSILSRTMNWIEVDLERPGVRDIRPGGFDRYEVFTAGGRRVSLGRGERVRFYETLVGPFEKIAPAVIVTLRPPPDGCCRFRLHLLAAAGPEVAADWQNAGR